MYKRQLNAWELIKEVEDLGGMTKAIESGLPKMRIEESAAIRQARIDSNKELIIGVNSYQSKTEPDIETLEVDNKKVIESQVERLKTIKNNRDHIKVQKALDAITKCAKEQNGNLLELAVNAAKERATLGEISNAMEQVFGRYQATVKTISGVYSNELMNDENYIKALDLAKQFETKSGRRPRIMICLLYTSDAADD